MDYAPSGTQIATGSDDGSIRIFEPGANFVTRKISGIHSGVIRALRYSRNGKFIASGCSERKLNIIDTQTWNVTPFNDYHKGNLDAIYQSQTNAFLILIQAR